MGSFNRLHKSLELNTGIHDACRIEIEVRLRAFVAIKLPREFAGEVADTARQLRAVMPGRYLPRENYHVTLVFLGDISVSQIDDIVGCMESAGAFAFRDIEEFSNAGDPILLMPDGIGKFGRANNATLWLGLQKTPTMMNLAACLRENLSEAGIDFDGKSFLPHITIARRVQIPNAELPPIIFPEPAGAASIVLYKSTLSKEGASYEPLHETRISSMKD